MKSRLIKWHDRFMGVPEGAGKKERKLYLWMQSANWFLPVTMGIQILFFDSRPLENPILFYTGFLTFFVGWSVFFGIKYKRERKKRLENLPLRNPPD